MAAFNKFESLSEALSKGVHQFHAAGHTLKVYLSNTAPSAAADLIKTDLAEIAAGNGYVAGGADVQNDTSRSGATTSVTGVDVTWTASGGTIGPFQYVVLYNDTAGSDELIGWWDRGSALTLDGANGDSFTTDFGSSLFTVGG
jgi:hypothetical protein